MLPTGATVGLRRGNPEVALAITKSSPISDRSTMVLNRPKKTSDRRNNQQEQWEQLSQQTGALTASVDNYKPVRHVKASHRGRVLFEFFEFFG